MGRDGGDGAGEQGAGEMVRWEVPPVFCLLSSVSCLPVSCVG